MNKTAPLCTQAAVVPAEDGVDEQPRDGAEQLAVESQTSAKLKRHREHPLPQGGFRQLRRLLRLATAYHSQSEIV